MTNEERKKILLSLPPSVFTYITSEETASGIVALYEKWGIAEFDKRLQLSAYAADTMIGISTENELKKVCLMIITDEARTNGFLGDLHHIVAKASRILKEATTPDQQTKTLEISRPNHDINAEWYNKERDEILREIEGPRPNTALTPKATNTKPQSSEALNSKPSSAPIKTMTPSAFSAALAQQRPANQAPVTATPTNTFSLPQQNNNIPRPQSTAAVPKPVAAPTESLINTSKQPVTAPNMPPKTVPNIFSMPRTTTEIKGGPATIKPNTQNNKPADPYREPPVA